MKGIRIVIGLIMLTMQVYGQTLLQKASQMEQAMNFQKALEYYQKAMKNVEKMSPKQKYLLYMGLGNTYLQVNDFENARVYLQQCLDNNLNTKQTYYLIGLAFLGLNDYEKALIAFENAQVTPENKTLVYKNIKQNIDLDAEIQTRIEMTHKALNKEHYLTWMKIRNMYALNSPYSEFGLYYNKPYFFYSTMKKTITSRKDERTLQGVSNIMYSKYQSYWDEEQPEKTRTQPKFSTTHSTSTHGWSKPQKLPYPFNNNQFNDGTLAIDFNEKVAYVMQCNEWKGNCKIAIIPFKDQFVARTSRTLPFHNKNYNFGHPCLSSDGKTMYFVSDMPGSAGGTDIWVTKKCEDGTWSQPVNIGSPINTSGDEMFPYLYNDSILVFASNGHKGYGGLDLYYAVMCPDGQFTRPVHFGIPINSGADDFSFTYIPEFTGGFFCSNRPGGLGSDDIYQFMGMPFSIPVKGKVFNSYTHESIEDATILISFKHQPLDSLGSNPDGLFHASIPLDQEMIFDVYKDGYSQNYKMMKISVKDLRDWLLSDTSDAKTIEFSLIPNKTGVTIEGRVTEKTTRKPLVGQSMILVGGDGYLDITATDVEGKYRFINVRENNTYTLMMASTGYWTMTKILDIPKLRRPTTFSVETGYNMDFEAIPIPQNEEIVLHNIFYEFDKAVLLEESKEELNKLAKMLRENPNLKVEIASHADERGSHEYNDVLTQRRAQAVVDYLISVGIEAERLVAKGYGKRKPIIPNAQTEEEHLINRRTTFTVLKIEEQSIEKFLESIMPELDERFVAKILASQTPKTGYIQQPPPPIHQTPGQASAIKQIFYTVQLAASTKPITDKSLFERAKTLLPQYEITEHFGTDGWYRYTIGQFSTLREATSIRNLLRDNGYTDCFVKIIGN